ncbi:MAG: hypothetical protein LCH52_02340 [Bacteroidetes bacterium]|nr:hypothetical protein [Bacteroidota bacterium]
MYGRTYAIEPVDDHIIVKMDGLNVLVDTGSPGSFAKNPSFTYNGVTETLPSSLLGMTDIHQVGELLGHPVDVLLGADLLSRHPVRIDLKKNSFTILEDISGEGAAVVPFRQTMGGVIFDMELNGELHPVILDSGAKISYISVDNPVAKSFTEQKTDFHPMTGNFETIVGEVPVRIAGKELTFTFGTLPDMLEMLLGLIGVPNIVGSDLFKNFEVVIDYANSRMLLRENN